ncbi:MAG: hypothetical protein QXP36_10195 [Conexivisphaerales archaeon]
MKFKKVLLGVLCFSVVSLYSCTQKPNMPKCSDPEVLSVLDQLSHYKSNGVVLSGFSQYKDPNEKLGIEYCQAIEGSQNSTEGPMIKYKVQVINDDNGTMQFLVTLVDDPVTDQDLRMLEN